MYVLLILILGSLNAFADDFEDRLIHRWKSLVSVKANPKLTPKKPIDKPVGTSLLVMEVSLNAQNFRPLKDCVFYQVPKAEQTGTLYTVQTSVENDCEDFLLDFSGLKKEGIFNFAFEVKKKAFRFYLDDKTLTFSFPKKKTVLVSTLKDESQYKLKNEQICYRVDDNCSVTQSNQCHLCPKSFLNIVDSNCPSDYSKICVDHGCGDLNQPACIRGRAASGFKLNYCLPDSPIGFCRPGLRVICEAERLVCK